MKNILYFILASGLLSACSGTHKKEGKSNVVSQCLTDKDYKYDDLLTKEDLAKYVDIDESSFKKEISTTKGKYGSCEYRWNSNRPKVETKAMDRTIKRLDNNHVRITKLDFYTVKDLEKNEKQSSIDLFDIAYKKLSQAEYDKIMANAKKKSGNNPKVLEQTEKMMKSRMNFTYQPITNLGDRAYWKWNDFGIELVVLVGNARFTIESKTTGESETSLKHAVNFAEEVLAKCEG